jgi:glucarate dehydratase
MSTRRRFLQAAGLGSSATMFAAPAFAAAEASNRTTSDLTIARVTVTPIALPDPPILAASGCHGPYFLRNIIELETVDGILGIGETRGGEERTTALRRAAGQVIGHSAFAYAGLPERLRTAAGEDTSRGDERDDSEDPFDPAVYAGFELACLDAIGKATGLTLSQLLGGPVRQEVEFAAYLFFRYAADHPQVMSDPRLCDNRGRGADALDPWGEVRTPERMGELAFQWQQQFGFRSMKLKAGVLAPDVELEALRAIHDRCPEARLRIDPNGRWRLPTAIRIGQKLWDLPLEYYEDPIAGQEGMSDVRAATGLPMSTNMCVTRFVHIPEAVVSQPVDIVLCDHHGWGGIPACQALGTMADALDWKLSQHSNNHAGITMAAMVHVGAVVPQLVHPSDTHYPWLPEGADIIEGPNLRFSGGRMPVPTSPGVGVRLDRDKLARAHEVYERCGMRERDDENTMSRFEPGWERTLF